MKNTIIHTTNKGAVVESSTYWGTHQEKEGCYYLTANAGHFRLLCPKGGGLIGEMATGKEVVMTIGEVKKVIQQGMVKGREMIELMFDDRTENPFCLFLSTELIERMPAASDYGKKFTFTAWEDRRGKPHRCLTRACYLRKSDLPNLKPARKH